MSNEVKPNVFKNHPFLSRFVVLVFITNFAGFLWAINPQTFGVYLWLLVFVPVNFIFLLVGLITVIVFQIKKRPLNFLIYYSIVILVPVIAQSLLFLLIYLFALKGGC